MLLVSFQDPHPEPLSQQGRGEQEISLTPPHP